MIPLIAYPIKDDPTPLEDELLKYSLRSLEHHGGVTGNVYMIGKRRDWFSHHIHMADVASAGQRKSKFLDVLIKLVTFCEMELPFVLMNDDFILCQETELIYSKYKALPSTTKLIDHHRSHTYQTMLLRTLALNGKKDMKAFVTHTPMLIDSPELMIENKQELVSKSFRQAYAIRRNLNDDPNTVVMEKDVKFKNPQTVIEWREIMRKNETISFHPAAVDKRLFTALEEMFPDKSKYEK